MQEESSEFALLPPDLTYALCRHVFATTCEESGGFYEKSQQTVFLPHHVKIPIRNIFANKNTKKNVFSP